ncbi:MAG TPA: CoA ester lyase [Mycobacteriales bacterium]
MRPYRSMLFLPGHRTSWVEKAIRSGADSIVLDLEDAVPTDLKAEARGLVADSIRRAKQIAPNVGVLVRVNGLATGETGADLEAVMVPGLDGVFAPKIEDPVDAIRFETLVDWFERRNGASGVELVIPMETAKAISQVESIATASPRIGAVIGSTAEHADVAREIGFEWTQGGLETLAHRSRVLLACRVAGVHAMTGLWERIDDLDGLKAFCDQGRQIGFRGMVVIHPSHVAVVNAAFGPSDEDVTFYQGLVEAYEKAAAEGAGAVVYRGRHIDKAHLDKAVEWLARADEIRALGAGRD